MLSYKKHTSTIYHNLWKKSRRRCVMELVKYVDPIIGTVGDEKDTSFHGGGKTHPGACAPGGMVQLSPDTVTGGDNGTGYNYCQNTIEGFSFNHMSGIGWYGDLGNLQVMPVVGETDLRSGSNQEVPFEKGTLGWKSPFSHEKEYARAGYYGVELERYGIFAEATVSAHTGMLRFTYPAKADARILFNFSRRIAGHADWEQVELLDDRTLQGSIRCTPAGGGFGRGGGNIAYTLHFACQLSVAPDKMQFFEKETYLASDLTRYEGEDVGLRMDFHKPEAPVVLRCGISYVDIDGAWNNLRTECPDFAFDSMAQKVAAAWEDALSLVMVEGNDETDKTLFYTCLYHTLLDPRTAEDVDGRFAIKGKIFAKEAHTQRTMFSGWDVYRSEFPLLTVIRPDMVNDTVNSLLKIAWLNNSSLPRWELMGIDSGCMVGDPGLIVAADAYIKGIRDFDAQKLYEIAIKSCKGGEEGFCTNHPVTACYRDHAYDKGSVSDTLELLLVDYGMFRMAQTMGKTADAAYFLDRTKRYSENYDPGFGFMRPRDENGAFLPVKDEYDETGCVESNLYQQSWYVPYDIPGLSRLFGKERCAELLERLFVKADFSALWNENYNHSNEPCHNLTHYFNMLGLAHRCQYWTRRVQKEAYRLGAFGFCGNEDVGQISAWYVLSALGFAQICPGYEGFFVNTPLFRTATIKLDKRYHRCAVSDTFTVTCDKDPLEYPYIRAVEYNGTALNRPYLIYQEITDGGIVRFLLSQEPCPEFGREIPKNFFED